MRNLAQDSFRIEISPTAWSRLGLVPQPAFAKMQRHLLELAQAAASSGQGRAKNVIALEGYVAHVSVDPFSGVITLEDVTAEPRISE